MTDPVLLSLLEDVAATLGSCDMPGCRSLHERARALLPVSCPICEERMSAELGGYHRCDCCGYVTGGPPARTTTNRILWNRRPKDGYDSGDVDEIVLQAEWLHVEQMDRACWNMIVDLPSGGQWIGNFTCDSRGNMKFSEQEQSGFVWDEDSTHESPDPAEET